MNTREVTKGRWSANEAGRNDDSMTRVIVEALKSYTMEHGKASLESQIGNYLDRKPGIRTTDPKEDETIAPIDSPVWEARSGMEKLFRMKMYRKSLDEKIEAEENELKNFVRKHAEDLRLKSSYLREVLETVDMWMAIYRNPYVSRGDIGRDREQQLQTQHENAMTILSRLEKLGYKLNKNYILDMTDIGKQLKDLIWKEPENREGEAHRKWEELVREIGDMAGKDIIHMTEELRVYQNKNK